MKTFSKKSGMARLVLWIAALLLGIYFFAIIFGQNGFMTMQSMHEELERIRLKNCRLEKENMDLYRTIHRLKNDPEFIGEIARQELNMVRPDEMVFTFDKAGQKDSHK